MLPVPRGIVNGLARMVDRQPSFDIGEGDAIGHRDAERTDRAMRNLIVYEELVVMGAIAIVGGGMASVQEATHDTSATFSVLVGENFYHGCVGVHIVPPHGCWQHVVGGSEPNAVRGGGESHGS